MRSDWVRPHEVEHALNLRGSGSACQEIDPRPRCRSSTLLPAKSSEVLVIGRYGGPIYPMRHEWSELQRAGRKVAECGSPRSQCSTPSLRS
jgi:hypothetical protein